jgi:hypothetical protein
VAREAQSWLRLVAERRLAMSAAQRIRSHEKIRHAAAHESAHALARTLLRSLSGVEFIALKLDEDGALLGNVRVNPKLPTELVFENVVAKLAGFAAEVVLLSEDREQARISAQDDFAQVEKLIAKLEADDQEYFRVRGMQSAFLFVEEHRDKILRLADELIATTLVPGARVRAIAGGAA